MRFIRLSLKRLLCLVGLGSRLIEYCLDCGKQQPLVWWCDDPALWQRIAGDAGVVCPACFNARAVKLKVFLRWYPVDESERANAGN